jgi:hypothetical protein
MKALHRTCNDGDGFLSPNQLDDRTRVNPSKWHSHTQPIKDYTCKRQTESINYDPW